MKVIATVILDLEHKSIISIKYQDKVLNQCAGSTRMKLSINNRVLGMPISEFKAEKCFQGNDRIFYITEIEMDVHTRVYKSEEKKIGYHCELHPIPVGTSLIPYEEYAALYTQYYEELIGQVVTKFMR